MRARTKSTWKNAFGLFALTYATCFWLAPVPIVAFANLLPYLHGHSLTMRFMVSLVPTLLIFGASCIAYRSSWTSFKRQPVLAVAGVLMFSFVAAAWVGNVFAPLVLFLPAHGYQRTLQVTDVDFRGTGFRRAKSLTLRDPTDGSIHYLTASRIIFGNIAIKSGDIISLQGRQNLFGVYVKHIGVAAT